MKKFSKLFLAAMLVFTVTACSSNDGSNNGSDADYNLETIAADVSEEIGSGNIDASPVGDFLAKDWYEMNGLKDEAEALKQFTGLTLGNTVQVEYLQNTMSFGFTRILMVEAKDGSADAVKAEVDAFITKAQGDAFYPEELLIAENPETFQDGNLFIVVFADNADLIMDFIKAEVK